MREHEMSFVIRTNLGLATGISRSRQGLAIFFLIIDPYEFSKPFIDPHENNSLKIQIWDAERKTFFFHCHRPSIDYFKWFRSITSDKIDSFDQIVPKRVKSTPGGRYSPTLPTSDLQVFSKHFLFSHRHFNLASKFWILLVWRPIPLWRQNLFLSSLIRSS